MKVWISLFVVLCFAGIARAQVPAEYPFMPLDNPAYADLKTWSGKDTNSYCCFSDPVKNPCQMTRYEFAVQVTRAIKFVTRFQAVNKNKADLITKFMLVT